MIHHGNLPESLLELSTSESWCRGSRFRGSLAATEPAGFLDGGRRRAIGILFLASLALEGRGSSLVELDLTVKDIVESDPELLEFNCLLGGQVAETAVGWEHGLDVGRDGS